MEYNTTTLFVNTYRYIVVKIQHIGVQSGIWTHGFTVLQTVALDRSAICTYLAESVGVEPTRPFRSVGLAIRCLTIQPTLQFLAEDGGVEPHPISENLVFKASRRTIPAASSS